METGDRVVQRKLNDSSTVVAQYVEKLASFLPQFLVITATIIAVLFVPFSYAFAAEPVDTAQTTSGAWTPAAILSVCGPTGDHVGITQGGFGSLACFDKDGHEITATPQAVTIGNLTIANNPGQCNWVALDFVNCIWNPLITFSASIIMSLAGMVLTVAGSLFDLLITNTVIDFGGTLQKIGMLDSTTSGVTTIGPITHIWATFRDVANILIIGIFVFVAISTILSIENYGARKWIAKILIVAVLINFSMFFTKITIDISNFVAREFYKTMPGLSSAAQNAATSIQPNNINNDTTTITDTGIAGTFMNDIGISGVWDWKYDKLSELTTNQGPLIMLGYSLGAAFFMIIVALTLLYASFLLASRAILLVFLLVTSSLAFASMLLPGKFAEGAWEKWKTSLINSAVFAPLLMLLLAATLLVLNGATNARGDSTLSAFLLDPTDTNGWTVLFIFIIASGMLFVSIKVANTFATKIAGFNYAAAVPALGIAAGAAVTSFGLRNTVGRGFTRSSENLATQARVLEGQGKHIRAGFTSMLSGGFSTVGKAGFNPLNTGAGKQFTSLAGGDKGPIGGAIKAATSAGKGGFIAQEKETIKKQQEYAEKLAPTTEQQAKIRNEALSNATPEQRQQYNAGLREVDIAKTQQSALETLHKNQIDTVNNEIKAAATAATQNQQDPQAQAELENAIRNRQALETRHSQEMSAAKTSVQTAEQIRKEAEAAIVPKESLQTTTRADNIADIAHRRATNVPFAWFTGQTTEKDKVAQKVRGAVKKKEQSDKEKERLNALVGDAAIPAPGTPPTTP